MIQGFDEIDVNFGQGHQKSDGDIGQCNDSYQRSFEGLHFCANVISLSSVGIAGMGKKYLGLQL